MARSYIMTEPHNLSRRRPLDPSLDALADSMKACSLRKGVTFQIPQREELDVLDPFRGGVPRFPTRSVTCPRALEDLLIGSGERRAVELLQRVDDAIVRRSELRGILNEPEVLPIPRFMLENATVPNLDTSKNIQSSHSQTDKDSGVGSSIGSSTAQKMRMSGVNNDNTRTSSAITRSFSGNTDATSHHLSDFAQQQINTFLIQPILKETSLKDFHPLVRNIPRKVGSKDIRTIRDLEKTLIFLAPDFSRSPSKYQSFCETSIRCLHLTVNGVHESDRCLPTDRPYSTNYFIDLVEQIRRYASILAATRANQARGEPLDKMDALPSDKIEIQGGMTHDNKPAYLTRRRDGKHISLATGLPLASEAVAAAAVKRIMDVAPDDDSVRRSMARRKKNAPIRTYHCRQGGCAKQFKRPCDLTKHIKTHERPFKCPDTDCKYYELGWPTEKECERHVNDKHSDTPTMYKCTAADCPYTSKRESNCKQHMEKAHGILYVRSKNNGKGKTPVTRIPKVFRSVTPDSGTEVSLSPPALSPSLGSSTRGGSPNNYATGSDAVSPAVPADFIPDFAAHFNHDYLNPSPPMPVTPTWTDDRRGSVHTEATSYSPYRYPMGDSEKVIMKNEEWDFTMLGDQNYRQVIPDSLLAGPAYRSNGEGSLSGVDGCDDLVQFSPGAYDYPIGGHFDDAMAMDQEFGDDFQLFGGALGQQNNMQPFLQDAAGFENMGSQFNATQNQTDLLTLFPELAGPQ